MNLVNAILISDKVLYGVLKFIADSKTTSKNLKTKTEKDDKKQELHLSCAEPGKYCLYINLCSINKFYIQLTFPG